MIYSVYCTYADSLLALPYEGNVFKHVGSVFKSPDFPPLYREDMGGRDLL